MQPLADRPFGVYVHFPYCSRRCPYCDFNVEVARSIPHEAYADAVLRELDRRADRFTGARLVSIYFGGGTPGLWQAAQVARIVEAIRARWPLYDDPTDRALTTALYGEDADNLEVTLETNPGAGSTEEDLAALREAGVNRLSVGVQTFDDAYLSRLYRDHTVDQSFATIDAARRAGFGRISFDLIFGGPGHDLAGLESDLETAGTLVGTDHCSAYSLIVEEGTPFARMRAKGKLDEASDDHVAEMVVSCEARLREHGYHRYEISSYARPGRESRHNSLYWVGAESMGLGVGAHELAFVDGAAVRRAGALRIDDYLRAPEASAADEERLDPRTHLAELLYLGLRTHFGVSVAHLLERFGEPLMDEVRPAIAALLRDGLAAFEDPVEGPRYLSGTGERLVPTRRGYLFNDEVARRVL